MKLCRLLLLTCLLLTLSNTPAHGQRVAWTDCRGDNIASFVNVAVLGTDSTSEILKHEETHRAQAQAYVDSLGFCPPLTLIERLQIEAGAYCASDSVRVQVKKTSVFETSAITLARLLRSFYPDLSADTVVATWKRVCP